MQENQSQAETHLERLFEKQAAKHLEQGKSYYKQGKLNKALGSLALVNHGNANIKEAQRLIGKIKEEINKAEIERIERVQKEKESQLNYWYFPIPRD